MPHPSPLLTVTSPPAVQMPIWDHLEELRERVLVAGLVAAASVLACFCFSKVGWGGCDRWHMAGSTLTDSTRRVWMRVWVKRG